MLIFRASLAALLAIGFTTGCAIRCPKGKYSDLQYQSHPTTPHRGEIAVVFAEDSPVCPPLEWKLFATDFETCWRRVQPWNAPQFHEHFDGAYGIEFQYACDGKSVVGCTKPPLESRILRVRDQQRLTVPVSFK